MCECVQNEIYCMYILTEQKGCHCWLRCFDVRYSHKMTISWASLSTSNFKNAIQWLFRYEHGFLWYALSFCYSTLLCNSIYLPWDQYLCLMLYHINAEYRDIVPKTKADLSGNWAEANWSKSRCAWQTGLSLWYHVPVFYTDLKFVLQHTFFIFQFLCGLS